MFQANFKTYLGSRENDKNVEKCASWSWRKFLVIKEYFVCIAPEFWLDRVFLEFLFQAAESYAQSEEQFKLELESQKRLANLYKVRFYIL